MLQAFALVVVAPSFAQQFQHQSGWIPGPARWSEGVEAADVDGDGDLDLFFADGEGFSSAGAKRQNVLVINQLVEVGPGSFADESVTRLGTHLSNAKGVITGDVDGDDWVDALFLNAFNTDPPSLYINRGAAQPGYFDLDSAARGLTEALSSAGGQFGDIDDDGDLDLVISDSGSNFLGGPGGQPILYLNDGNGFFTESATFSPPTKVAHMDIQLSDVDSDWDLDVVGINRATNAGGNHYLLLNDGAGGFTNQSSLLPATSANCYEAEVGDLDGDTDQDIFFISLTGFQEGHVANRLVETSTLQFVAGSPQPGSVDDNEVAYLDHDNDGDYDVVIGSLDTKERLYENQGGLVFAEISSAFTAVSDSTLDLTVADVDGDGAYDVITAQGESSSPQWINKVYRNTGASDGIAPRFVDERVPQSPLAWPVIVHAKVRDQVLDDGQAYLTAYAAYAAVTSPDVQVVHQGGVFAPNSIQIEPGTRVSFTNQEVVAQSATSATPPWAFDLLLAANGGSADYVFITPGNYLVTSNPSAAQLQIAVGGTAAQAPATPSGGGIFRFELAAQPSGPSGQFAYELFVEDFAGNPSVSASQVFASPTCDFSNYCSTSSNSVGTGALMSTNARTSVSENSFSLSAGLVPIQPGLFFYSAGQTNGGAGVAFGNGLRCVGNATNQIFRLPVLMADGSGNFRYDVDFTALPVGGDISGGSTWYFQAWYRDPMGGGAAFNLSDGLRVTFCP